MTDPVEVMAEQIARAVGFTNGLMSLPREGRDKFRVRAQAALSALDAAGFAVLPKIETDDMCAAGLEALRDNLGHSAVVIVSDAATCYRAMLSSAQVKP